MGVGSFESLFLKSHEFEPNDLSLCNLAVGIACQAVAQDQTPVSVTKPLLDANESRFQFTGTITSERVASLSLEWRA